MQSIAGYYELQTKEGNNILFYMCNNLPKKKKKEKEKER
jgi:hypothetical protein